jgi:hypothetical protein
MENMNEIGEMLDTVSSKIPGLIKGVIGTLYSADAGSNMGKAVGSFYKELVEAGIPADEAIKMARDYMLSLKDVSGMMNNK